MNCTQCTVHSAHVFVHILHLKATVQCQLHQFVTARTSDDDDKIRRTRNSAVTTTTNAKELYMCCSMPQNAQ